MLAANKPELVKQQRNRTMSRRPTMVFTFVLLKFKYSILAISRFDKCKASWVRASDLRSGAALGRTLRSDMSSVCFNCWTSSISKNSASSWNPAGTLVMGEVGNGTPIGESSWAGNNNWWRVIFDFAKQKNKHFIFRQT